MRFRKLKANEHIEGLQELYEEAFPKEEQIPYDRLIQLVGEMSLDFVVYYQDACEQSEILGFTMKDYDDVLNELKCFWWRKDLENETEKVE